ncbi:MAG TPA: hypothetical protein VN310_14110, partial [Candidatus Dormibacteraeota bacterium]|nr:hypothetical protein [Candidatus Dormibacteraeota bacterium]
MPIAEKTLIAQVRRLAALAKNPAIQAGIGDDCAVLRLVTGRGRTRGVEKDTLVTTDFTLEG